jgi:hypothetical protein
MPSLKQKQDLEQYWRTGKQSASADADDDNEADGPDIREDIESQWAGDTKCSADDAVYAGPEDGPFQCATCIFFQSDGQPCQMVSDPVESEGCCVLWKSAESEQGEYAQSSGSIQD